MGVARGAVRDAATEQKRLALPAAAAASGDDGGGDDDDDGPPPDLRAAAALLASGVLAIADGGDAALTLGTSLLEQPALLGERLQLVSGGRFLVEPPAGGAASTGLRARRPEVARRAERRSRRRSLPERSRRHWLSATAAASRRRRWRIGSSSTRPGCGRARGWRRPSGGRCCSALGTTARARAPRASSSAPLGGLTDGAQALRAALETEIAERAARALLEDEDGASATGAPPAGDGKKKQEEA